MRIVALLNEKGGAGKSTLAINLAVALHRRGLRVVLVDADLQGTARDWREASPEGASLPDVVALDRPEMLSSIKSLNAEVVIIDTPAKAEKMSASVVRIASLALIPAQPSAADVWASAAAVRLVDYKRSIGGEIDAAFVLNRVSRTKISREMLTGEWNEYGIDIAETTISNRVAYAQALADGLSVFETGDLLAQEEINNLVNELEAAKWL